MEDGRTTPDSYILWFNVFLRPNDSYGYWISKMTGKEDGINRYAELYK